MFAKLSLLSIPSGKVVSINFYIWNNNVKICWLLILWTPVLKPKYCLFLLAFCWINTIQAERAPVHYVCIYLLTINYLCVYYIVSILSPFSSEVAVFSCVDVSVCLVNTCILVSSTSNVYVLLISILDVTLNKCVMCLSLFTICDQSLTSKLKKQSPTSFWPVFASPYNNPYFQDVLGKKRIQLKYT